MSTEPLLDITIDNGKYRIVQDATGKTEAFRYGEYWLPVSVTTGGNLILAMAYELEELRQKPISNEAAIAVGEDAFKAGWNARSKAIDDYLMHDKTPDVEAAWSDYEPAEDIKALV